MALDPTSENNFIRSIDKAIVGIALAAMALIPTQFFATFRPDKLWPLIDNTLPKGRMGMILGPGIFFLLSSAVHALIVSRIIGDGSVMQSAATVDAAVQGVNLGQILLALFPAFLIALFVALKIWVVTRYTLTGWTVHHSIKTALYAACARLWIIFPIEFIASNLAQEDSIGRLFGIVLLQSIYTYVWFFFIFRQASGNERSRLVLASAIIAFIWGFLMLINYNGIAVIK